MNSNSNSNSKNKGKLLSATIGNKLKMLRIELNISQCDFAELLGYSVSGYAKIERNETDLTIAKLENIAKILGISIITLLFFGNDKIENYEI